MAPSKVFVCGVTGIQGSAVATILQQESPSTEIVSISRSPQSPAARKILSEVSNLSIFEGAYDFEPILQKVLPGCSAIYINLVPHMQNPAQEMAEAGTLLKLAREAGVKHVVYASGVGTDQMTYDNPIAMMFKPKYDIEQMVKSSGFELWTILRPGSFDTNFLPPFVSMFSGLLETGVWDTAATKEARLPTMDPHTLGRFASAAIRDPAKFNGKMIEVADEKLTIDQILKKISDLTGRKLSARYLTEAEIKERSSAEPMLMVHSYMSDKIDGFVDMDKVRSFGVGLSTFDRWAAREKAALKATYNP